MAKKPDDIYKKEELPLFAQKGYRRKRKEGKTSAEKPTTSKENPSSVYSQDSRGKRKEGDELFKLRLRGSSRKRLSTQNNRIRKIIWATIISLASLYAIILISVVVSRLVQQRQSKQSHLKKQSELIEKVVAQEAEDKKAVAESIVPQINTLISNSKASKATLNHLTASKLKAKVDLENEITRLEATRAKVPNELAITIELAQRYLSSEDPARAIPLALILSETQPQIVDHKVLLGRSLLKSGDYPAALRVGQWILEADPFSIAGNGLMANAFLQMNKLESAIKHLHKVVDVDNRNIVAQNNLGVAYTRIGQYDRAAKIFEGILLQDASSSVTYFNLSSCYAKADKPEKSVQVLQRAINHFGKNFISAWLEGPTFSAVKAHPDFAKLQLELSVNNTAQSMPKDLPKEAPDTNVKGSSKTDKPELLPSGR